MLFFERGDEILLQHIQRKKKGNFSRSGVSRKTSQTVHEVAESCSCSIDDNGDIVI